MRQGLAAAGLALFLLGAGCSADGGSSRDASASASPSPSASESLVGPIVVEPGTLQVQTTVGRLLDFAVVGDPADWLVQSSDRAVIEVIQGGMQGDAVMNPGGRALTKGEATVTLTDTTATEDPAATKWQVLVTVS